MKTGTVLLVEDDPDDAALTLMSLRLNKFTPSVIVAQDGQAALKHLTGAEGLKVSLIILDLKLPKIGGLELLARMRALPALKHLPVVILTSSNEPKDRREAERLDARAYFIKPLTLDEFKPIVERLRAILNETA